MQMIRGFSKKGWSAFICQSAVQTRWCIDNGEGDVQSGNGQTIASNTWAVVLVQEALDVCEVVQKQYLKAA